MKIQETLVILETLAAGCSPSTGEVVRHDSVLNERNVIRALQQAIDHLKTKIEQVPTPSIHIEHSDIIDIIALFKTEQVNITIHKLVVFLLGIRKFKNETITLHPLYGKYKGMYPKGQLMDFFPQYLNDYNISFKKAKPYKDIDFFQQATFNNLSEKAVQQLKEKVSELGILKTKNLSETVLQSRLTHPRAYEAWTETEKELLKKAIQYTNDLDLLATCFQRGKGAIQSCGQQIIYAINNPITPEDNVI